MPRTINVPVWVGLIIATGWSPAWAGQAHHGSPPEPPPSQSDPHAGHAETPAGPKDRATTRLSLFEASRIVSGTAWQPPGTPHSAVHARAGDWDLMAHALFFGGYDWQGSDRGDHAAALVGWLMGMADRRFDSGVFSARVMLSPEFLTVRSGGYPLLLQTGETYNDEPLHDRQHPHDLLMEAAIIYTQELHSSLALQLYAAASGEPALGPPGFPHRFSSSADPLAPLGHHWQDSTHISFGVLTAGIVTRHAKLEGSWFNGREPDETRYDVELRRPDSYAARLSVNPTQTLVGQLSYGYLPSPERLHPDVELHRLTASVTYHRPLASARHVATTLAYGMNKEGGEAATSAAVIETMLALNASNVLFGRAEYAEKTGHDLVLTPERDEDRFRVGSLVLGYLRNFGPFGSLLPGIGIRGALNVISGTLEPFYGTRVPVGAMIYLRLGVAPMESAH